MKKLFRVLCVVWLLLFGLSGTVYAQNVGDDEYLDPELESCFVYYDYGKLKANLATNKSRYAPGETATIIGTLVNENTFPLVNVTLYAHLKRVNNTDTYAQNGHFLIERIVLLKNLNFLPGETKGISVTLPIVGTYPDGNYQLQYFLFSSEGFHYAGRPFLEEDTAGVSLFEIRNGIPPEVYFDIDNFTVNDQKHTIRELISEYPAGPVSFRLGVTDRRQQKSNIPVTIRWYSFEDNFEKNLISSETALYQPDSQFLEANFTPENPGAYILVAEIETPVKSIFKYRFARIGNTAIELHMNDLGITSYPPGQDDRAYVCFHSPTRAATLPTSVTLSVLDASKNVIEEKNVVRSFDREIRAISVPLGKINNAKDFWIRAQFEQADNKQSNRQTEIHYSCDTFRTSPVRLDGKYLDASRSLEIDGINTCNGTIGGNGYIETVRIIQNGFLQYEVYNLTGKSVPLSKLPGGKYTAEIKSGILTTAVSFTLPPSEEELPEQTYSEKALARFLWWLLLPALLMLAFVWWYLKKRKKRRI